MKSEQPLFSMVGDHLISDKTPSSAINALAEDQRFGIYPWSMLLPLKQTQQSPLHHPQGSVWNHTMLVVDEAAKAKELSKDAPALLWAALLHDIGKPAVTKTRNGKITAYRHDEAGAVLAGRFMSMLTKNRDLVSKTISLVRWHMQLLYVVNGLPFAQIGAMLSEADAAEVGILCFCDRMGRGHADLRTEEKNTAWFLRRCLLTELGHIKRSMPVADR